MRKLLLLSLIFLAACQSSEDINPKIEAVTPSPFELELLTLVNTTRKSGCTCGSTKMAPVPVVGWQKQLESAAIKHSQDMEKQNYFSHTGKNGSSPGDRITAEGYKWRTYGENIALGYPDAPAVVAGWIKSEGHCKNIMNENFKEMGVGRSGSYWTQILSTPL
jgi:uncharacterized protein YkwD